MLSVMCLPALATQESFIFAHNLTASGVLNPKSYATLRGNSRISASILGLQPLV